MELKVGGATGPKYGEKSAEGYAGEASSSWADILI